MKRNFSQSLDTMSSGRAIAPDAARPGADEIAALAYQLWLARGCPEGSAEADWIRAEEELRGGGELMAA